MSFNPHEVSCSTFSKCSFQQNMSITLVNQIPQKLEARKLGRVGMTPNKWATLDLANVNDDLSVAPKGTILMTAIVRPKKAALLALTTDYSPFANRGRSLGDVQAPRGPTPVLRFGDTTHCSP